MEPTGWAGLFTALWAFVLAGLGLWALKSLWRGDGWWRIFTVSGPLFGPRPDDTGGVAQDIPHGFQDLEPFPLFEHLRTDHAGTWNQRVAGTDVNAVDPADIHASAHGMTHD